MARGGHLVKVTGIHCCSATSWVPDT